MYFHLSVENYLKPTNESEIILGAIVSKYPSPDTPWSQMVYEVSKSLNITVLIADTRGPRTSEQHVAEPCNRSPSKLLSAMPTQRKLDKALLEITFKALQTSRFAVVVIDCDEASSKSAISSTIEELLNEATMRDHIARIFRLRGHEIDAGNDREYKWKEAVLTVANRWRKFVILGCDPRYVRKFIHVALDIGLAGRGYKYLTLNFDFHLEPLDVTCSIEQHTSVSSVRLRRVPTVDDYESYEDSSEINNRNLQPAFTDQIFNTMAIEVTMESIAESIVENQDQIQANEINGNKQCLSEILSHTFEKDRRGWILELLNMTNDGYFVRLQYIFATEKLQWILNPYYSLMFQSQSKKAKRSASSTMTSSERRNDEDHEDDSHILPCQNNRRLRITTIIVIIIYQPMLVVLVCFSRNLRIS